MLVKIGNTDITKHILAGTYAINAEDVYNEWTDSNKIIHKDVVRQRISGNFELKFNTEAEYKAFVSLVQENRTLSHQIPMSVYVVNEDQTKQSVFYYHMAAAVSKSLMSGKRYQSFVFEVMEA